VVPTFQKSPPELVERFTALAEAIPDGQRRSMFGYPAVTINGHLCFSLHENHAILRLPEDARTDLGDAYPLRIFEPMPGRPMQEYVIVPDALLASPAVEEWVERSAAHVRALPPKPPRKR
jgi:hypothetical protein